MPNRWLLIIGGLATGLLVAGLVSHHRIGNEYKALEMRRASLLLNVVHKIKAATLFECVRAAATQAKCNIVIDEPALNARGIDAAASLRHHLYDVTLQEALEVICNYNGGFARLGWYWRGESIVITTAEDSAVHSLTLRVYDVRDLRCLAAEEPNLSKAPEFSSSTSYPASGSLFGTAQTSSQVLAAEEAEDFELLIRLVEDKVASESWRDEGGTIGSIYLVSGRLYVVQTQANQKLVADFLESLRAFNACQ